MEEKLFVLDCKIKDAKYAEGYIRGDFCNLDFDARFIVRENLCEEKELKGYLCANIISQKGAIEGKFENKFEKITYESIHRDSNKILLNIGDYVFIKKDNTGAFYSYIIKEIGTNDVFVLELTNNN